MLFFFVVLFFAEDAFLVVDFLADFLAAMALVPPFLAGTVKVRKKIVNDFLLARKFFSAHPRGAFFARGARDSRCAEEDATAEARRRGGRRGEEF